MRLNPETSGGRFCDSSSAIVLPSGQAAMARAESVWRAAWRACGLFEWLTFSYLGSLNLLLVFFGQNVPRAATYFALHICIGAAVLVLIYAARHRERGILYFLRHWYPPALFLFFFEELHYLSHLVFPGWFDRWLIQFDYALLGTHPTVWMEGFSSPVFNEAMQFAYMTYYFYTLVLGWALLRGGEQRAFWRVMVSTAAAYYLGYIVAILFPVEGPFHTLAALQRTELTGGLITSVMDVVERFGRVHGAAFPSAHVSGSFVALLGAWRYRRRLFWIFLPFFSAMLVATVHGRYHYVADIMGGLLVGAIGYRLVGSPLLARYLTAGSIARVSNDRSAAAASSSVTSSRMGVSVMYPRANAQTSVPSSSSFIGCHFDQK